MLGRMTRRATDLAGLPPLETLEPAWRACVEEAWGAYRAGSLPIGAVLVDEDGAVVARGRNRLAEGGGEAGAEGAPAYLSGLPLAHAEVNALLALGGRRPEPGWTLWTSTEPCPLCMGASRMSGVPHVRYASRDAWAGCAVMADVVPYVRDRGPSIAGPEPALEPALLAWQVERHVAWHDREPPFLDAWRAVDAHACDVGVALYRDGALQALAHAGADAAAAWALLAERTGAGR